MKAPTLHIYNNLFDELMDHTMRLSHADRLVLIRRMEQKINLDETLPARLTGLDGKVCTSPKTNTGGVL